MVGHSSNTPVCHPINQSTGSLPQPSLLLHAAAMEGFLTTIIDIQKKYRGETGIANEKF